MTAERVVAEYQEQPSLALTLEQAAKLFHLPKIEMHATLTEFVARGILTIGPDGKYRLGSRQDR